VNPVAYDPSVRNRAIVLGSMVALLPTIAHAAGETSARPQVHVIPPPATGKEGGEPDDLPGPPLEVVPGAANIKLPAVPDLVRTSDARSTPAPSPASVAVVTQAPQRKIVTLHARNLSVESLNTCNDAIAARRYKAALGACRSAIAAWEGNHLAWYGAGNAHMARDEWTLAAAALERAVTLRPDVAMYQMTYGIALYEAEIARARQERARKERKESDDGGSTDPTLLRLDAARAALVRAITIAPNLWRAHSYLGYLYRDLRDPRAAAEELSVALKANPGDRASYVALAELYRRTGFHTEALAVAVVGVANIPRSPELWFEVAMSYEALNDEDKAIDALTRGLAVAPESVILKVQRGRLYAIRHRAQLARRDLESVASNVDPAVAPAKQLAELLLAHLAGGISPQDAYRACKALNGCKIFRDPYLVWLSEDWSAL
jgi:tetratricopeptide (TPR) repeat protein